MSCVPLELEPKTCACGVVFGRRRHGSGKLESPLSYAVRTQCDLCKPPRAHRTTTPAATHKTCEYCGAVFARRRYANGILVPRGEWDKQRYCSAAHYDAARSAARAAAQEAARTVKQEAKAARQEAARASRAAQKLAVAERTPKRTRKLERDHPARAPKAPKSAPKAPQAKPATVTAPKRSQGHTAPHYGLGPLQPFAFNTPNVKRHDLIAERESGASRPEPSDGEIMALLKVCLELHAPLLECFEEAAQAARPVRRVPRAAAVRARWQT